MHITLDDGDNFEQTFGGESYIDNYKMDDYGFQLGELYIHNIKSDELKKLAIASINHLMVNGHDFRFGGNKLVDAT
jgi:hypothetical protein